MPSATVKTADLRKALKLAVPYTATRCPLPICANVKLVASAGTLVVEATNLDHAIRTTLTCAGDDIALCAPAKELKSIVDGAKAHTEIELEQEGWNLIVHAGRNKSRLRCMSPSDFPVIRQEADERHIFIIEADALKRLVTRTSYAAQKDPGPYILAGIHLESDEGNLIAGATDGTRIATAEEPTISSATASLTVPPKMLKQAAASLEGVVYATETPKHDQLILSAGGTTVAMRTLSGTYPNLREVIPSQFRGSIIADPNELLHAIKSAATGARITAKSRDAEEQSVRIETVSASEVRIASNDDDGNEFAVRVPAEVTGPGITVAFQSEYLVEAVKALVGGITTSKAATIATTTVNVPPSPCIPPRGGTPVPIAPRPEPTVKAVDPMVARAALESARLRLGVTERLFGKDSPQFHAAQARLHAAGTAQTISPAVTGGTTGAVVAQPVCEPPRVRPTVVRRTPDPAAPIPTDSGSTITLSFTGPNSACLIRGQNEATGTHVIMPMLCDTGRKARDERAA